MAYKRLTDTYIDIVESYIYSLPLPGNLKNEKELVSLAKSHRCKLYIDVSRSPQFASLGELEASKGNIIKFLSDPNWNKLTGYKLKFKGRNLKDAQKYLNDIMKKEFPQDDTEPLVENKTLASDSDFRVVELKNGQIRFEFDRYLNVRNGEVLMTKKDFRKMKEFMDKHSRNLGTIR